MKKLGAILFVIVLILGLPFVATAEQQVETVNPDGVYSCCAWSPTPTAGILQYGPDADDSFITTQYESDNLTVDFVDPAGGPYTAIKVKLRMNSGGWGTMMYVGVKDGKGSIGNWTVNTGDGFQEYSREWTGLNIDAADLAGLQIQILFDYHAGDEISISAVQVELVSEGTDPIPEVTDPIHVNIDYRPYRNSNPLNYRSRGKVRVVIFGSADFDVRQIDRESVLLAGVAPVRDRIRKIYSRTDGARDDYEDLVLMFKTQQLIEALEKSLEQELENSGDVFLTLTGSLKDDGATPIEGQDTAVVFGKRHKHKKKYNWKNNWKWWR